MTENIDFEFTLEDLYRNMINEIDAGEEDEVKQVKTKRPNFLETLRIGGKLGQLNKGKQV